MAQAWQGSDALSGGHVLPRRGTPGFQHLETLGSPSGFVRDEQNVGMVESGPLAPVSAKAASSITGMCISLRRATQRRIGHSAALVEVGVRPMPWPRGTLNSVHLFGCVAQARISRRRNFSGLGRDPWREGDWARPGFRTLQERINETYLPEVLV